MKCALCSILFLLPVFLCGQVKHTPTLDEMLSLKIISLPKISPDGRFVAYRVRETDWKEDAYVWQLWLINVSTGSSFQLTRGKKFADQEEWSPDGNWLAFITERASSAIEPVEKKEEKGEKTADKGPQETGKEESKDAEHDGKKPAPHQIWLISPQGGEAWQLTKFESDIESFHWSRDSKSIAFTAKSPETKAHKDRKEKYSDYEVFEKDYDQRQLWLVDVTTAAQSCLPATAKKLTSDASMNISSFSWSPDSSKIAFSASNSPLLAFNGEQDIYLLDLPQNDVVKKIVALPGPDSSPTFSPDGKQLVFSTALGQPYYYYSNGHIATVDIATVIAKPAVAPGDVRDLTRDFDEDPQLVDWGPDGVYFAALQKTSIHLFRVSSESHEIRTINSPDALFIEDGSFTKDFKTVVF